MKIKNLAFCGVMASILGLTGAYAADATIIASKAYVDARDNLKEDVGNKETETYANSTNKTSTTVYPSMYTLDSAVSNLNTTIGTNALSTNVLADGVDGTKLTKASAITAAKSTTNLATTDASTNVVTISNGDDTHFPTTKVVADTIKALDSISSTSNTAADNAVSAVSQADGQVSVTTAKLSAAAIDSSAKAAGNILENADDTDLVVVGGVKNTVVKQGTFNQAWNAAFTDAAATEGGATNMYKATTNRTINQAATPDDFVPTVAAVEKRVQAAIAEAGSNAESLKDSAASATWDSENHTLTIVTGDNAGNKTDKLATSAQVNTSVSALKSYADDKIGNTAMGTEATTLTGAIAELGTEKLDKNTAITASTNAMNIVTYDANGLVTGGKILNTTGLNDINRATNSGTICSASNPCVLTYTGTDYKWTNMDTDSLSAVADTNS